MKKHHLPRLIGSVISNISEIIRPAAKIIAILTREAFSLRLNIRPFISTNNDAITIKHIKK
jgi:hypothetical protein